MTTEPEEDIVAQEPQTLTELIHQMVGAASVCWENGNVPTGTFDEQAALNIASRTEQWILQRFELKDEYK